MSVPLTEWLFYEAPPVTTCAARLYLSGGGAPVLEVACSAPPGHEGPHEYRASDERGQWQVLWSTTPRDGGE
jgi:hypothetical protein